MTDDLTDEEWQYLEDTFGFPRKAYEANPFHRAYLTYLRAVVARGKRSEETHATIVQSIEEVKAADAETVTLRQAP